MYGKIFEQIFSSSIMEEELVVRYVFMSMVVIAGPNGIIDITRQALARKFNISSKEIDIAIDRLESPDPASRDSDFEGRRLVRLDDHRNWGWHVVNHRKYVEMIKKQEKLEYDRQRIKLLREARKHNKIIDVVESRVESQKVAHTDSDSDSDSDADSNTNNSPLPPKGEDGFGRFWKVYPAKFSKGQAEKAWRKLKPNKQLTETILQAVERAKTSEKWQRDAGQYVPYPATWLNARGWEDEGNEIASDGSLSSWAEKKKRELANASG